MLGERRREVANQSVGTPPNTVDARHDRRQTGRAPGCREKRPRKTAWTVETPDTPEGEQRTANEGTGSTNTGQRPRNGPAKQPRENPEERPWEIQRAMEAANAANVRKQASDEGTNSTGHGSPRQHRWKWTSESPAHSPPNQPPEQHSPLQIGNICPPAGPRCAGRVDSYPASWTSEWRAQEDSRMRQWKSC